MADTMRSGDSFSPGTVTEGAGGVVFDPDGRVLLIRHRKGEWVFPKGHVDAGEDHLATAVREVEEEAGLVARCERPDLTWTTRYVNDRGVARRITWYRLEAPRGAAPDMRERQFPEGAFVDLGEALERLTFEEDKEMLQRVVDETADGTPGDDRDDAPRGSHAGPRGSGGR